MAEPNARELKLIQYLNEAYGTEKQLETALQAHIQMATRSSYRKRLQQHLTETRRHGREVERRIKQLGGKAETVAIPVGAEAAQRVQSMAGRALAAAQGPLHALRGTGEAERQLKNAKTEFASEAEEIATYTAIISVAESLGDRETVKLARVILREEERMRGFLEKEIPRLATAVVTAEVPRSQRANGGRRRKASSRTRRSSTSRSTQARGASASRRAATSRKAGTSRKAAGSRKAATSRKVSTGSPRSSTRRTSSRTASTQRSSSRGRGRRASSTRTAARRARPARATATAR